MLLFVKYILVKNIKLLINREYIIIQTAIGFIFSFVFKYLPNKMLLCSMYAHWNFKNE